MANARLLSQCCQLLERGLLNPAPADGKIVIEPSEETEHQVPIQVIHETIPTVTIMVQEEVEQPISIPVDHQKHSSVSDLLDYLDELRSSPETLERLLQSD